jgi:hypothetical protein
VSTEALQLRSLHLQSSVGNVCRENAVDGQPAHERIWKALTDSEAESQTLALPAAELDVAAAVLRRAQAQQPRELSSICS